MDTMNKKIVLKKEKNKLTVIKHQLDIIMKILIASQENKIDLDLEDLINFPLTLVPFYLGTADGFLAKIDKSKGMQYLTNEMEL